MTPLYRYNGKLLVVDGKLATNQNCCCEECPAYPVTVYITGGIMFSGGYRSLEIQCFDANNFLTYQKRENNGNFGGLNGTPTYSNGLAVIDPDPEPPNTAKNQGCLAVEVHQFLTANDAPFEVFPVGQTDGFSITVSPDEFECCVLYEYQENWCDNPQVWEDPPGRWIGECCGTCEDNEDCSPGCECVDGECVEEECGSEDNPCEDPPP